MAADKERDPGSSSAEIGKYLDILAKDPNSRVFAPLAEAYRKAGLFDDAVEIALEGLKVHPNYLGGRVALGRAYFEKKQYAEAAAEMQKVAKAAPDNIIAHKVLGQIAYSQKTTCAPPRRPSRWSSCSIPGTRRRSSSSRTSPGEPRPRRRQRRANAAAGATAATVEPPSRPRAAAAVAHELPASTSRSDERGSSAPVRLDAADRRRQHQRTGAAAGTPRRRAAGAVRGSRSRWTSSRTRAPERSRRSCSRGANAAGVPNPRPSTATGASSLRRSRSPRAGRRMELEVFSRVPGPSGPRQPAGPPPPVPTAVGRRAGVAVRGVRPPEPQRPAVTSKGERTAFGEIDLESTAYESRRTSRSPSRATSRRSRCSPASRVITRRPGGEGRARR